jgi:hypothetical protein
LERIISRSLAWVSSFFERKAWSIPSRRCVRSRDRRRLREDPDDLGDALEEVLVPLELERELAEGLRPRGHRRR